MARAMRDIRWHPHPSPRWGKPPAAFAEERHRARRNDSQLAERMRVFSDDGTCIVAEQRSTHGAGWRIWEHGRKAEYVDRFAKVRAAAFVYMTEIVVSQAKVSYLMSQTLRIIGLVGSLRAASYSRTVLETIAEMLPDGTKFEAIDIGSLPHYNEDLEKDVLPDPVAYGREMVAASDAVLIVTPEFNHGIPGVLKNTLDWLSRRLSTVALSTSRFCS
ncbi:NADPH-dependent FMN reductase [Rhizobium sp. RCAM05973]|uniref:NADPH-dependent FMN reductase n=1 Tax=Rhizobium sp. RCAM05973 TaxID=2994066 RepID=UPI0022EBC470|nr:NADPH-dependent FMN reductase [Rhizobium sp. RCAM05973]